MSKTRTGRVAVGVLAFLILGACGGGGGSTNSAPTANAGATSTEHSTATLQDSAPRPAAGAGAGEGQASRVFIDPITGEFRAPTAAELAASKASQSTEQALKPRPAPPVQTRLPDGTIMYDMRNQPQVEEKACVLADGSIGGCPAKKQAAP